MPYLAPHDMPASALRGSPDPLPVRTGPFPLPTHPSPVIIPPPYFTATRNSLRRRGYANCVVETWRPPATYHEKRLGQPPKAAAQAAQAARRGQPPGTERPAGATQAELKRHQAAREACVAELQVPLSSPLPVPI